MVVLVVVVNSGEGSRPQCSCRLFRLPQAPPPPPQSSKSSSSSTGTTTNDTMTEPLRPLTRLELGLVAVLAHPQGPFTQVVLAPVPRPHPVAVATAASGGLGLEAPPLAASCDPSRPRTSPRSVHEVTQSSVPLPKPKQQHPHPHPRPQLPHERPA